jgi:hypothetical protein
MPAAASPISVSPPFLVQSDSPRRALPRGGSRLTASALFGPSHFVLYGDESTQKASSRGPRAI